MNDLEIDPPEVARLLKENSIQLIDVRTPVEYSIAHIEGSKLVDQALVDEIIESWPKDTQVVTMCHHGIRSLDAAAFLRAKGFQNVRSMRGGIDRWSTSIDSSVPRY